MKILVGCEESQTVTVELRKLGHEAYSCDIQGCSGGHPEWHIKGDVFEAIESRMWDMGLFFPPCTHLSLSGAKHFSKKRADGRQKEAIEFFMRLYHCGMPQLAIENPMNIIGGEYIDRWFPDIAVKYGGLPKKTQVIQPWQFGDEAQKTTWLWLRNLPPLAPTDIVGKGEFYISPKGKRLPAWYGDAVGEDGKKLPYGGQEIKRLRSKTFPGVAKAMALQWAGDNTVTPQEQSRQIIK